ncbi:MAG: lysophospholipid acyltransferase family protein [Thermoanaerobaculia bacterium]|nr:lysophospholipid acyltransferase family protein [Thermoanaerobaculia bacterium]
MTWSQTIWRRVCQFMVRIFYRRFEAVGTDDLPADGPIILCANHVNALVDALVIQAACPRPIHPIARSGLFRNPLLRPILSFIQAVPIYRRHQPRADAGPIRKMIDQHQARRGDRNEGSFSKLYELLDEGRVILIFPEGQSHSDPSLRPLKTGAARLALGHFERTGEPAPVVPIGLLFTAKGRFRAGALVQVGEPVTFVPQTEEDPEAQVRRYTEDIDGALKQVTLNMESWEDKALMDVLQRYFHPSLTVPSESGNEEPLGEQPTLSRRFLSYQRILHVRETLRPTCPERVERLRHDLARFERLCARYGVRDYHLELNYTPRTVGLWLLRNLLFALFVVPLGLWGLLNSGIPYYLARKASQLSARARDHYDTAGMLWGLFFFLLFWGAQTAFVFFTWGSWPAVAYGASLGVTAGVSLKLGRERRRILDESRVFWLFVLRRNVKEHLRDRRDDLEVEVEELAQMARQLERESRAAVDPTAPASKEATSA